MADTAAVGAMAEVRQTVYGMPPQGQELVKRQGDSVVFAETIETRAASTARIRFIDDSSLALGEKSKVLIDLACSSHNAMWEKNHGLLFQASAEWLTKGTIQGKEQGEIRVGD